MKNNEDIYVRIRKNIIEIQKEEYFKSLLFYSKNLFNKYYNKSSFSVHYSGYLSTFLIDNKSLKINQLELEKNFIELTIFLVSGTYDDELIGLSKSDFISNELISKLKKDVFLSNSAFLSNKLNKYYENLEKFQIERKNYNLPSLNEKQVINKVKWSGSQTEFIELIKALIENGNLKGKQKDIISSFSEFFDFQIKNPDKLITDIKKRNSGSETLFIDKLKASLFDYLTRENIR